MAAASKAPTHVTAKFVCVEGRLRAADQMLFSAQFKKLNPEEGEVFYGRFEREAEARRRHRDKWYWGYIVDQCIEHTGETARERHDDFQARFLPPECASYHEMNDEQAADYNLHCEVYAAETIGVVIEGPHEARNWTA